MVSDDRLRSDVRSYERHVRRQRIENLLMIAVLALLLGLFGFAIFFLLYLRPYEDSPVDAYGNIRVPKESTVPGRER